MLRGKKIIIVLVSIFLTSISFSQHPDLKKIDSLKNLLPIVNLPAQE